ncbi:hypothetical protein NUW54_g3598 [Trametes sanguinea]|uniref:Uncharacterized protein n=1 Tax=Trametes sanguinea TaxID=158606 RepID=A0ACC1Q324_9APHY|nr:hypothetical protein NUW54_g3598 [Trametes sanguinea]
MSLHALNADPASQPTFPYTTTGWLDGGDGGSGDELCPSQEALPYPLPPDARCGEMQEHLHELVRGLTWDPCFRKLQSLLFSRPNLIPTVLDVGSGSGCWIIEMAKFLPGVQCYGCDLVPVTNVLTEPNVSIEVRNIRSGLGCPDGSYDVIHARNVAIGVPEYEKFVSNAARALRPAGLLSLTEWTRTIEMADSTLLEDRAPRAYAFLIALENILGHICHIKSVLPLLNGAIHGERLFARSMPITRRFYVGDWPVGSSDRHDGIRMRDVLIEFAKSMREFLGKYLITPLVDDLIEGFVSDLNTVSPMYTTYHTVHAMRAAH